MKKSMIRILTLVMAAMLLCLPVMAEEEAADTFTSASVNDSYTDYAMTGTELVDAINSYAGFYLVTTTNPDGSANSGFFIYGAAELDGKLYLKMGFGENQTKLNIAENGEGMAVYAAAPSEKPFAMAGARMYFQLVTDEEVMKALEIDPEGAYMLVEVTEIKSLG